MGQGTMLNESTISEAQSMMQGVSKEYISNRGTLNRILGDEELPVCSGMGVVFMGGVGKPEWKNAEFPSRSKQIAICSAYYMKKTTLSRTYFKNIFLRKQIYFILQFLLSKQNILFSNI